MPVVFRTDSDNVRHQIWAQEQANSCAIASIWMARNQAKQMTFSQDEWSLAHQIYGQVVQGQRWVPRPPAPMSLNPAAFQNNQDSFGNMFANFGTFMRQVAQALRNDGLKVTLVSPPTLGVNIDPMKLGEAKPAIILLGWYTSAPALQRQGGHFVVATRVASNGRIVILDPWQGVINEVSAGPNYPGGGIFEEIAYLST